MTIHPKVQQLVAEADARRELKHESRIDAPVDENAVARVLQAFPEFRQAYEGDGMTIDEFDSFGAVVMTLDAFDKTGWQKLLDL
jgi:wyosine [tRNA(Phe)-imidazoG37] synthetase (radical SAM superfamily)